MHAVVNPACHGARDSIGLGPRYRLRVQRPHVYGDEKRFRANLAQHVQRARALLDEAEGVRKRIDKRVAATSEAYRDLTVFAMGHEWTEKVAKWRRNAGKFATAHLGDQLEDLLAVLTDGEQEGALPASDTLIGGTEVRSEKG